MNKSLKIIKTIVIIIFFLALIYFFWYITVIDHRNKVSLLNGEVTVMDGRYYLRDNDKNLCEVTKEHLDVLIVTTNLFVICTGYMLFYMIYIWIRFLIFPNIKKTYLFFKKDKQ